jgi:hypothetical protein
MLMEIKKGNKWKILGAWAKKSKMGGHHHRLWTFNRTAAKQFVDRTMWIDEITRIRETLQNYEIFVDEIYYHKSVTLPKCSCNWKKNIPS